MKSLLFIFFSCLLLQAHYLVAQDTARITQLKATYNQAYHQLKEMVEQNQPGTFKNAVFITENTFLGNSLDYRAYREKISQLAFLVSAWAKGNRMQQYRYADSSNMVTNYGIYTLMKDSISIIGNQPADTFTTIPFTYDFNDHAGKSDWTKMFVTKLLYTYSGNCHSLPYLYKILADELGATCWLSLAPNHIYIKNRSKKSGWYNTELTSGSFPVDAWITASGYIPLQAIRNGIYMDTLSNQQAIAMCVLDLAKGYAFQFNNNDDDFILQCCDLVLLYHPVNVQALLLKAETLKRGYEKLLYQNDAGAQALYSRMESVYIQLLDLGYREMPEKMYLNWLSQVMTEKEKYNNTQLPQLQPAKKAF